MNNEVQKKKSLGKKAEKLNFRVAEGQIVKSNL